jgi:hypothetical protein
MKNKQTGTVINVVAHGITRNFWEYYITDNKFDENTVQCLVMGFETELGDVYMPEIKPYLISVTKDLKRIAPAEGWEWVK